MIPSGGSPTTSSYANPQARSSNTPYGPLEYLWSRRQYRTPLGTAFVVRPWVLCRV